MGASDVKYKPLTPPKSKRSIAKQLRWLAEHMADVAASMDYYGGLAEWSKHGEELAYAAMICKDWARAIDDQEPSRPVAKFMDNIDGRALVAGLVDARAHRT